MFTAFTKERSLRSLKHFKHKLLINLWVFMYNCQHFMTSRARNLGNLPLYFGKNRSRTMDLKELYKFKL